MGLKAKFNLVMLTAFLVGLGARRRLSWQIVHDTARRAVLQEATIMTAQASAVRHYTDSEIDPLLAEQNKVRFLPQSIPFYAAQKTMRALSRQFPGLYLQGSGAEPDQSGGSCHRLGEPA